METEPLRFTNEQAANEWLAQVGQTGLPHTVGPASVIIVRFERDGVWAFAAPDLLVHLPDW